MYEVIWLRLLGLVFGNTTYAVSTVLSAYMAGLGLGSFFLGRWAERAARPLRAYGILEIGIGIYAALTPLCLWLIRSVYLAFGSADPGQPSSIALKFFLSFLVVFIPTFFMGGTLPVLTKLFFKRKDDAGEAVGLLYALNTAGAMTGTLLAGFWLLPALGVNGLLTVSVLLNLAIGALALLLSAETESTPVVKIPPASGDAAKLPLALPLGLFVSGATAMIYEVGWTRILATVLSSSTYAFTMMLASFLFGIALGSWASKRYLASRAPDGIAWGWLQLVIALSSLIALPLFPWVSLFVVRLYGLSIGHPYLLLFLMCAVCLLLMIVPAFCFGALFPLSNALFIRGGGDATRKVGVLYLWNTVGNIAGSVAAGFWLIPRIGIHGAICVAVACGALLSAITAWAVRKRPMQNALLFVAALGVLIGVSTMMEKGWDRRLVSSGLNIDASLVVGQKTEQVLSRLFNHRILYYKEGLNSIVAVGQEGENRYLKVNGKTDASTLGDLSTQLLLGHLPHLLHPGAKRSLVIGFGSGMTLASALTWPVESVDCVEIEPAVLEAAPFFESVNRGTEKDPRAKILLNDGRNHLLMEKGKYDVIISEPSNPWMAGVSALFTSDFYRLVETHLNEKGALCQWIHAYAIKPEDFWMVVASVREVFPHVTLWRANADDFLIIAQREPFRFDLDGAQERFGANPQAQKDLAQLGIEGAAGILARFQFGDEAVAAYVEQARINTDDLLPLEFSTPLSLYDWNEDLKEDLKRIAEKSPLPPIDMNGAPALERPGVLVDIGKGYLGMDNTPKAKEYFKKAGDTPEGMTGLGRALLAEGKNLLAAALFEQAQTAEALDYLGRHYWLQADYPKALESFEGSIAKDPVNWEVYTWKGQVLEDLARPEEALAAYQKGRSLSGERLGIRLAVARAERLAGHTEHAVEELEALLKEYPLHYPIYQELRSSYIALDRIDPLIKHYEFLTEANPYFQPYWLDLIGLYLKKGDQEGVDYAAEKARHAV